MNTTNIVIYFCLLAAVICGISAFFIMRKPKKKAPATTAVGTSDRKRDRGWIPFIFEGSMYWRVDVMSLEDWRKVVSDYKKLTGDSGSPLMARRSGTYRDGRVTVRGMDLFGFGPGFNGSTLEEWAKERGMELPLK